MNCRIITATHKNLALEVKNGNFRLDLFYRLLGFPIELPPLRERNNDVLILAKHFVKSFCSENNLAEKKLTTSAINKIKNYSFPGNIRELKSIIELAVTLSSTNEITDHDILFNSSEILENQSFEDLTLREYEMKIINSYLQKYNNDVRLVAKKLAIGSATIYRMLKEKKQN